MNNYIIHWKKDGQIMKWPHDGDLYSLRSYVNNIRNNDPNYELVAVEELVTIRMRIDIDGEV